ncbi:MAG: metal-sensitive transcriptional regulator [Leptospirales bacterium]
MPGNNKASNHDAEVSGHNHSAKHPEKLKIDMKNRLSRIEGQVRGLSRMIDENVYCDSVLHQILSVESAMAGVKKTLLEAHIKGCVIDQIRNGDDEVVNELMVTMGKMMK